MKKIFYTLMITLSLIVFSGCNKEHNGNVIESSQMTVGVEYTVSSGDIIISSSADTKITVLHTLSSGAKKVTLTSGTAKLIKVKG